MSACHPRGSNLLGGVALTLVNLRGHGGVTVDDSKEASCGLVRDRRGKAMHSKGARN